MKHSSSAARKDVVLVEKEDAFQPTVMGDIMAENSLHMVCPVRGNTHVKLHRVWEPACPGDAAKSLSRIHTVG